MPTETFTDEDLGLSQPKTFSDADLGLEEAPPAFNAWTSPVDPAIVAAAPWMAPPPPAEPPPSLTPEAAAGPSQGGIEQLTPYRTKPIPEIANTFETFGPPPPLGAVAPAGVPVPEPALPPKNLPAALAAPTPDFSTPELPAYNIPPVGDPSKGFDTRPVESLQEIPEPFLKLPTAPNIEDVPATAGERYGPGAFVVPPALTEAVAGKEVADLQVQVQRQLWNVAKSLPEFMTTEEGILSVLAGMISPAAVEAYFLYDMAKALKEQASQAGENWDTMTAPEKARAIVDAAGTTAFSLLLGKGLAKSVPKEVANVRANNVSPIGAERMGKDFSQGVEQAQFQKQLDAATSPMAIKGDILETPELPFPKGAKPDPSIEGFVNGIYDGLPSDTQKAREAGVKVKSLDDLEALAKASDYARGELENAKAQKDFETMLKWGSSIVQLPREAVEAATGFGSGMEPGATYPMDWRTHPEVAKWIVDNAERMRWVSRDSSGAIIENPSLPEVRDFVKSLEPKPTTPAAAIPTLPDPAPGTVRVFSGGGSSFGTTNVKRAGSFGTVRFVDVPQDVFDAATERAKAEGSYTTGDVLLPNEWVNKSKDLREALLNPPKPAATTPSIPKPDINTPLENPNGKDREVQNDIFGRRRKQVSDFIDSLEDGNYVVTDQDGLEMEVEVQTSKKDGRKIVFSKKGNEFDLHGELGWSRIIHPDGRTEWTHSVIKPATSKPITPAAPTPPGPQKAKPSFYVRPRPDGVPDILEAIQDLGGMAPLDEKIYGNWRDKVRGVGRLIIRKNGLSADRLVDTLSGKHTRTGSQAEAPQIFKVRSIDDIIEAIGAAVSEREKLKESGGGPDAQADRFWTHSDPPNKEGLVRKNVQELKVGDKLKLRGSSEELTVTHIDPDTMETSIKGGKIYGTQHLPDGAEIWVREKDFKPAEDTSMDWPEAEPQTPEPLNQWGVPESRWREMAKYNEAEQRAKWGESRTDIIARVTMQPRWLRDYKPGDIVEVDGKREEIVKQKGKSTFVREPGTTGPGVEISWSADRPGWKKVEPIAPKLRPGEKGTGDLMQGPDQPFNLTGEKGTDAERLAAEKAAAEKRAADAAEFDKKNQGDLPNVEPPAEPPAPPAPPPPEPKKPFGGENKLVTPERAEELKRKIREKMRKATGNVSMLGSGGLDPSIFSDAVQLGAYYLEAGFRKFEPWAEKMIEDLGEEIRGHLKSIYETVRSTVEQTSRVEDIPKSPGLQPGLRRPEERITTARGNVTRTFDESVIPPELVQHLEPHQRQGAAAGITSMEERGGALNSDGTGAGKTRQSLTVAHYNAKKGHRVIIVTPASTFKPDWKNGTFGGSYGHDSKAMGVNVRLARDGNVRPGEIGITTYENAAAVARNTDGNTVLIFDESHYLKNKSERGHQGLLAIAKAKSVLFMSATPADKPEHIYYLARIGIMEGKSEGQQLRDLGMKLVTMDKMVKDDRGNWTRRKVTFWAEDGNISNEERNKRFSSLFDRMTEKGAMIKREISMDGVNVRILRIALPPEGHAVQKKILNEGYDVDSTDDLKGLRKAVALGHMRRQQEPFKIAPAILLAKRELDAGRQVVIFVSRINESPVIRRDKVRMPDGSIETIETEIMRSPGTAKTLKEELLAQGITDIAEIHGNADQGSLAAMADFQSGKKRVVIATIESGGTGINLDDVVGNRPRSMVVVTAPFDAVGNVQAAGRIWRLKTLSGAKIYYLLADTKVDEWNAGIIGNKMSTLGAVVEGEVRRLDVSDPDYVTTDDFVEHVERKPEAPGPSGEDVQGASGGPTAPLAPGASPVPLKTPKSQRQIITDLAKGLGLPIRFGRLRYRFGGYFLPRADLITSKKANDIPVVSHEVGHKLDKEFSFSADKTLKAELMNLGDPSLPGSHSSWTPSKTVKYRLGEGIAEFVRKWLTDPPSAAAIAPNVAARFEAVLIANKDFGDVMRTAQEDIQTWRAAEPQARLRSHISVGENPNKTPYTISQLTRDLVDDLHFVKLAVEDANRMDKGTRIPASFDPYVAARNLRGSYGMADTFIRKGVTDFRTKAVTMGTSLEDALKPIAGRIADFRDWIVAKRAQELHSQGRQTGLVPADVSATAARFDGDPAFQEAFQKIKEWNDAVLQYAVDAGLVTTEAAVHMRNMNQDYVPFHRVFEVGAGEPPSAEATGTGRGLNVGKPASMRGLHGSPRPIVDPLETMVKNAYSIITAAEKAAINRNVAALADKPGMGKWVERIGTPKDMVKVGLEKIRDQLEAEGADLSQVRDDLMLQFFQNSKHARFGENTIRIVNAFGKPEFYRLKRELFDTFHALDMEDSGTILRILSSPAQLLRAGVTMSPDFALANAIRDTFGAAILSRYGAFPFHVTLKGIAAMLRDPKLAAEWAAAGGKSAIEANYFDRTKLQQFLNEHITKDLTPAERALIVVKSPLMALRWLTGISEEATRIGEYKTAFDALIKQGVPEGDARRMAAFDARNRQDFAKGGAKTKALRHSAAFWNAGLQANVRLAQAFKERPMATTLKGLAFITTAKMAEQAANWNDDDYWDRPQWERDLFFLIPIGKGEDRHTRFLRVPVPFELGVIFATIPGRMLQAYRNKNPDSIKSMPWFLAGQSIPNPLPQTLQVLFADFLSGKKGWDIWRGKTVVPESLADYPAEMQWTEQTSLTARKIGKTFGYSPMKVDHIIANTTGGLGKQLTHNVLDRGIEAATGEKRTASGYVPGGRFVTTPAAVASESITQFYDVLSNLREDKERVKAGGPVTRAQVWVPEFEKTARRISDLNRVIRHPTSPTERQQKYEEKLRITRELMARYNKQPH